MEKGFILPGGVYVQAIDTGSRRNENGEIIRPEITAADYPAGTVEVPLKPGSDHHWTGSAWEHRAPAIVPADLSPPQFEYLLARTGFGDVWDAMAAQAKASGDLATFAALKAERSRSRFVLDIVISQIAAFRSILPPEAEGVDLSESAVRAAWAEAEQYGGLGNG